MIKGKSSQYYSTEQIVYAFAGLNEVSDEEELVIADTLTVLDKDLVDKIVREVYFISASLIKAACLPLSTSQLEDKKAIIFLSNELSQQKRTNVKQDILHEVAHYALGHKCMFDFKAENMKKSCLRQEKEADKLVKKGNRDVPARDIPVDPTSFKLNKLHRSIK